MSPPFFLFFFYLFPFVFLSQLFGCGSVAQTVLSKGALGEPLTIHVGFTLGVMMAVYVAGGVSGKSSARRRKTAHIHYTSEKKILPHQLLRLI